MSLSAEMLPYEFSGGFDSGSGGGAGNGGGAGSGGGEALAGEGCEATDEYPLPQANCVGELESGGPEGGQYALVCEDGVCKIPEYGDCSEGDEGLCVSGLGCVDASGKSMCLDQTQICPPMYGFVSESDRTCVDCASHFAPANGYFAPDTGVYAGVCESCGEAMLGCKTCESATNCQECIPNHAFQSATDLTCVEQRRCGIEILEEDCEGSSGFYLPDSGLIGVTARCEVQQVFVGVFWCVAICSDFNSDAESCDSVDDCQHDGTQCKFSV